MKCVKLKNIADVISGGTAPKDNEFSSDGIPFIRVSNLDFLINGGNETSLPKVDEETAKKKKYKLITKGTIVFAKSGMSSMKNRVYELRHDAYIVNHLAGIMFRDTQLSPYMKYWLENFKPSRLIVDEAYPSIRLSDVKEISINLPPLQTQKKIVGVLDKAQELIALRKKQIELLDELIQSIFYDMFGDPVTNPKGWKKIKLENLCDIYRGGSPRPIMDFLGGSVPWIKIGDATKGDDIYLSSTKEHIIEEGVKKSRLVKKGSLIFANCGVSLGFARITKFDGCIHDGWLSFENINDSIDKVFLLKLLNCYTEYFRRIAPDGTQPNLNTKIMKAFEVIVPPFGLQESYRKKINSIVHQKHLMQQSLTEMENNFNSLMQRAFKGKLFN